MVPAGSVVSRSPRPKTCACQWVLSEVDNPYRLSGIVSDDFFLCKLRLYHLVIEDFIYMYNNSPVPTFSSSVVSDRFCDVVFDVDVPNAVSYTHLTLPTMPDV